ncbi:alpha/beta hydrolase [Salinispirillum sp. LH 10-3-1]|uniref:Alpha/beta hydrolase n=1 Tax=Salinispirillum sp. LH 10-3-1 TaxID=2952525 RepID=A0AB38YHY1_9GAMM
MKSALMMLPGLLCDQKVWEPQIDALQADMDCRAVCYDVAVSLPDMAREVLRVAPKRFSVVGHSMGGRVAMEVLRLAPERIECAIFMDTGYKAVADGAVGEQEIAGRMRLVKMAQEQGMRVMGQDWLQGMVHPERRRDTQLCTDILDMISSKTPALFQRQINALILRPDATDVLRSIQCPTLFVTGRQDAWSPVAQHQEMADLVPGSQMMVIEDAGHMSTMEQPEAVTQVLRDFLLAHS